MPQYSGAITYVPAMAADTRTILQNNFRNNLIAAGWTVISGGGTNDTILQSAATANGNFIQIRIYDSGSGNCTQFYLRNAIGTRVSRAYYLLPGTGKTYKFIANKFQAFCYTPGTSACREFLCFGVPITPSFLNGFVNGELGWIHSNSHTDADTSTAASFRTALWAGSGENANTMTTGLCNSTLTDYNSQGVKGSHVQLVLSSPAQANLQGSGFRWVDDTLLICEPLISWGDGDNLEGKLRGILSDAILVTDSFAADSQITVDGHTWIAVTGNNVGTAASTWVPTGLKGTLFLAIN